MIEKRYGAKVKKNVITSASQYSIIYRLIFHHAIQPIYGLSDFPLMAGDNQMGGIMAKVPYLGEEVAWEAQALPYPFLPTKHHSLVTKCFTFHSIIFIA